MNSAALITSHLNAPFGAVLSAQDVAQSLCFGKLCAKTGQANALLAYLFVETEPRLIATCAREVGSSLVNANQLYLDTLAHHAPRCPQWERAVQELL
jgi:hypothetical protein